MDLKNNFDVIDEAYLISKKALRNCYSDKGIVAGISHFSDVWARDSFYASLGALELGDYEIVGKNLNLFLRRVRSDGLVPLRVGNKDLKLTFIIESVFPFLASKNKANTPNYSKFTNDRNNYEPLDPNSLLLITAQNYIEKTNNYFFAERNYSTFENIINYLFNQIDSESGLIKNKPASSWDDSLNFDEEFIYTNICFAKAINSMKQISIFLNKEDDVKKYETLYLNIKSKINASFWNGDYYNSIIIHKTGNKKLDNQNISDSLVFNSAGNILATVFDISDKTQSMNIEKSVDKFGINKYMPSLTNKPKYSKKREFNVFRIINMGDYHNDGMSWSWIGAMGAISRYKSGDDDGAIEILTKISEQIVKDKDVYEVYEKSKNPVNRFIYKTEKSFAWSAGLFIKAYHIINKH